ncbi:Protein of unknown function [Gryllus bimaculatus]|nr:Protein of unknown function [Gryllus bimaculatus]
MSSCCRAFIFCCSKFSVAMTPSFKYCSFNFKYIYAFFNIVLHQNLSLPCLSRKQQNTHPHNQTLQLYGKQADIDIIMS